MAFFQNSILKKYLKAQEQDQDKIDEAYSKLKIYQNKAEQVSSFREEEYQSDFLNDVFVNVLGYKSKYQTNNNFNLVREEKNESDSKKADGAIIKNDKIIAVIELKGTGTKDLNKVAKQAFGYMNNHEYCIYVVTSNFEKLRFYINKEVDFIEFNLFKINKEDFRLLWLCLSAENLLNDIPLNLKKDSIMSDQKITEKLYKDYSSFRKELFNSIVDKNKGYSRLVLFNKTQKLLDRFLFIFFAEDRLLVPANSITKIIEKWEDDVSYGSNTSLYSTFKTYFNVLNKGRKAKGQREAIFAYNGGLFANDEILDVIEIDNEILFRYTRKLSEYDFESEVSVNILGHIFENSLSEIEDIQNELQQNEPTAEVSKRKKDGIFYTPEYITKYIVLNTVGKLCGEKKKELGIIDEEFAKGRRNRKKEIILRLDKNLKEYRQWLRNITICDPACGSGAFLNQALNFLLEEHKYIDELYAQLFGSSIVFQDISPHILENNLYGVDINNESVEIAKLSLWLRTAQKGRKLSSLSQNLKCGNSLIEDKDVAHDKAFDWHDEFPEVFSNGGFDIIIGNPPYGAKIKEQDIDFLTNKFKGYISGNVDTYIVFYFVASKILKDNGIIGFITPDTWLTISSAKGLREFMSLSSTLEDIHDWYKPFKDAKDTRCHTVCYRKKQSESYQFKITVVNSKNNVLKSYLLKNTNLENFEEWNLYISPKEKMIFKKMIDKSVDLEEVYNIKYGLRTGNNAKYLTNIISESEDQIKIARGSNIEDYYFNWSPEYLITKEGLPVSYFEDFVLNKPKIIIQYVRTNSTAIDCKWLEAALIDEPNFVPLNSTSFVYTKNEDYNLNFLLSIISSKLLNYYYKAHYTDVNVKPLYLSKLPIPKISIEKQILFKEKVNDMLKITNDFRTRIFKFTTYLCNNYQIKANSKLNNWYDLEFVDFIKELNKLIKKEGNETIDDDKSRYNIMDLFLEKKNEVVNIENKIKKQENLLNQMVYDVYDLSEEEICLIEHK